MRNVSHRLFSLAALLVAASWLPAQDRRPLTHDDYDQWQSLRGTAYSPDGSWVAYQLEPQWGDGTLVVRRVGDDTIHRHPLGSGARFSADGRFVVFTVGKSKVAEREQKIEELRKKAKAANQPGGAAKEGEAEKAPEGSAGAGGGEAPRRGGRPGGAGPGAGGRGPGAPAGEGDETSARERGELHVLELATGKVEKLGKVKGSTLPDDVPFLLYHKEKPEPKPDDKKPEVDKPEPEAAGKEPGNEPTPGSAETEPKPAASAAKAEAGEPPGGVAKRRGGAPKDPLEAKRPDGTELVVRDLALGTERTIADVAAYGLSRQGTWLWYHTSSKQPAKDGKYGLFVQKLAGGEPIQLLDGIARVANVTIDRAERLVAFTSDKEDFAADKPQSDLYLWEGDGPAQRIVWAGTPGLPIGKRLGGSVSFSRDGSTLLFGVQDAPAPEPLPILPEDKVTLDLWNWRDGMLQTQQQKRGQAERNPTWTAVWHRDTRRLLVLGDEAVRSLRFVGPTGDTLLGSDGRAYDKEVTWDGRYNDIWLVDGRTGQRTKVLDKLRGNVTNSPGGKYLVWFGADYRWWSLDVKSGVRRDLTGGLGVPFHRHDDDHPEPDAPYGLAGWTEHDGAVLIHDEFDLWRIHPASGEAVCITDGHGRQQRLRLRQQPLPRQDDREWVDDELLLAATAVDTMAEGFYADSVTRSQPPRRLLMADANFGDVTRCKRGNRLFFTQGTFATFPDLWTASPDFGDRRRLSDANPQQQNYRWGKAELVRWVDGDGNDRQGVLIKPDGFDPTRKYPMMVHFYERMTQGLHNYVAPAPGTSPNASYYVSNGYLWFMPDVVYEIGYPGNSCVKCVVSGVQHLIAQGFVDPKAVAASGHSWGGYQTAFLVTRTNIFACVESGAPVSNMLSAYGGIRYESGMSRQFQYEMTQSRIGGTPWQYPLRYQENSPIWFADKVQTPVLLLHNDQDGAVPWTQGIEYFTALRRLDKECYLFNYNGEGHGLRNRANMKDWSRRMAEFFDHHCKGAPAPKWMTDGVPFHERELEKLPFAQSYVDAHVKPAPAPKVETPAAAEPAAAATAPAATSGANAGASSAASGDSARASSEPGTEPGRRRSRDGAVPAPKLKRGDAAPDFAIADQAGTLHQLQDYRGCQLLIWFYPKASTPGCTAQGCGLRDAHVQFVQQGVAVLGVSFDAPADNAAFRQQHGLPFPLLCDTARTMALAYGACAEVGAAVPRRIAVLVGPDGRVVQVWNRVDPRTFAAAALQALAL
ncbi:MAG: prolyl oligopeptidase family serine peptidase [Planctomycetes bacterium]|jgi:dipeptidyl aminopeptidase/acylaminoacyl peptidase/peroxiredoxin|nr:prolyl oligopeptidase family serine peptidase [Planctomycetota bacterium]